MTITTYAVEAPTLAALPPVVGAMGIDLTGPNALVAQVFAFLVGIIALVALWKAVVNGKPKLLFGLLGCVLIAGFIYRFTDVKKIKDNDLYTGVEDIGGIGGGDGEGEGPP